MANTDARIAIATGASRAVGREVAARLASYSSDAAPVEKLAKGAAAAGGRALPVKARLTPLKRLGLSRDVASAFPAGPNGSWINGQVLRASGGTI